MSAHVERHMGIVIYMSGLYYWQMIGMDMRTRAQGPVGVVSLHSHKKPLRNHIFEDGKRHLFILWCANIVVTSRNVVVSQIAGNSTDFAITSSG